MSRGQLARRSLAGAIGVAILLAIGALSRVPYDAEGAEDALLRLSWRIRGERVEECRPLTEAEQAVLPPHMRRDEVCEGRVAPYHLLVRIGGRVIEERTVAAAGAREDRPLYVFREVRLPPGTYPIEVSFTRLQTGGVRTESERPDRARTDPAAPHDLRLRGELALAPGRVVLVTYDPDTRELVLRGGVRTDR